MSENAHKRRSRSPKKSTSGDVRPLAGQKRKRPKEKDGHEQKGTKEASKMENAIDVANKAREQCQSIRRASNDPHLPGEKLIEHEMTNALTWPKNIIGTPP